MDKPLIPKRLAAKIRAAQERVKSARYAIISGEEKISQDADRIAEYIANPSAFASRYYGNNPPDSYPVQTNIARYRENLDRLLRRRSEHISELISAELNLETVEDCVLKEISEMRADTRGRIPWPHPVDSLEEMRRVESLTRTREAQELELQRIKDQSAFEEEIRQLEEAARIESDQLLSEWQDRLSRMNPAERAAAMNAVRRTLEALESGDIGTRQFIGYVLGRSKGKT